MKRLITLLFMFCVCLVSVDAQTARDYVRRGNRLMTDTVGGKELSEKAIVQYKKALEKDSTMAIARYNLGNALIRQSKAQDALSEYRVAAKYSTDKQQLSDIYHNMGVLAQASKQYEQAVACYKESLRNDPSNNETRYNYVLAKWQLKKQQEENKNNEDNNDKQDKQDKQQQQQQQQQSQQDEQQQQEQQEQPQQQQPQDKQEMPKETAERLLQAAMRNEKETQEKMQKMQKEAPRRRLQKQW